MKFFHLSDLHLGRRIFEFSLIDDQQYILDRIIGRVAEEKPDAVVIAGDIYDRQMPSVEAVQLFDDFLTRISALGVKLLIASGNHDSPERLAFGGRLMSSSGVYIAGAFDGNPAKITLQDHYGEVNFWLMPFIKPATIRKFFPEAEIADTKDAVKLIIGSLPLDESKRNVLIAHQFVTGAERSESEEASVGGSDNVDSEIFARFDYTALGHIHRPQSISPTIRYCGSPLKYSFSEAPFAKSITMVELAEKGRAEITLIPLNPLHEMRELKGKFGDLTIPDRYEKLKNDYIHIILTDEEDIPDAAAKLRLCYPGLMKLSYDNTRTRSEVEIESAVDERTPLELFSDFYAAQNGHEMSPEQLEFMKEMIGGIFE